MTESEKLALAQHVLASIAQALVLLPGEHDGDTIAVPRPWVEAWLAQSRAALGLLRRP
jgi:hypothetical protein